MLAGDTTFIISLQHGLWSSLIIILIDINKIFFFKFKMHCIDMDCAFMHGQLFWQMYGKGRLFFFFCKSVYQQCLKHCSFAWKKLCTFPSDVENTPVWRCESTKSAKFSAIFFKAASSSVLSDYDSKTLQKQNTDVCLWSVSGTPGQWEPMRNYSNHLEKHL